MYRVEILLARLKLGFSALGRKARIAAVILPMTALLLILSLTSLGHKAALVFSGNPSVYQNLPVLLNSDPLKVHIIDVGQGDASLIQYEGYSILIDTGPEEASMDLISYLKALGISRLDLVVLTHPHDDHTGGAPSVLQSFRVGTLLLPHELKEDRYSLEALEKAKQGGTEVAISQRGMGFRLGGLTSLCLHPGSGSYSDTNDYSSVWSFTLGASRFLFLGDLSVYQAEKLKLAEHGFVRSGHHGSVTSTSEALLRALKPSLFAISCGQGNRFGHPSREVLVLLDELDVPFLRTDQTGTSVFSTDGEVLRRVH